MGAYVTMSERKAAQRDAIAQAVADLRPALAEYARRHGGRFLLYGSAARGGLRHDSDVDLLVDFPDAEQSAAWRFAEQACWDRGVTPDIRPFGWCSAEFLAHVLPDAVTLG